MKNPENRSFKIVYCENTKAKLKKGKKYFCRVFLPLFKKIIKNQKILPPKKLKSWREIAPKTRYLKTHIRLIVNFYASKYFFSERALNSASNAVLNIC